MSHAAAHYTSTGLDTRKIAEELTTLDAVGHYNRPDVFQFSVNADPLQTTLPS